MKPVRLNNVRVAELISHLARLSLRYDVVDIVLDFDTRTVMFDPVLPPVSEEQIDEVIIEDKDIKDLIS